MTRPDTTTDRATAHATTARAATAGSTSVPPRGPRAVACTRTAVPAQRRDRGTVVLVDPLHTGAGFKRAARERGYRVVAIYTMPREVLRAIDPEYTRGAVLNLHTRDVPRAARSLPSDVVAVVPATEPSVDFADRLAARLGLPGNLPATARARRDKTEMRRRAVGSGIRVPRHQVTHAAGIRSAADALGYPAILKPPTGAGSAGVTLLPDAAAADRAVAALTGTDLFGAPVLRYLVEEYVRGRELAVNVFTVDGVHQLVDVWEYRRPDGADYDQPYWDVVQLDPDDPAAAAGWAFARTVIDAFGVRTGPSHTEIKLGAAGPVLIETASRLPGAHMTDVWAAHAGLRPFEATIQALCADGTAGRGALAAFTRPVTFDARPAVCCIGNDDRPGLLTAVHGIDDVLAIPGVAQVLLGYEVGQQVPLTTGLDSVVATVLLSAPDRHTLTDVLDRVRGTLKVEIS
ncbi:ATP-grasp domain-containing protein [Nakamurella sp. YIM 132087]|uniref:ATP-grasp domain-containing protein n=1 Tax=Nakamurella alba TaxID=2665158 RepID=A0A7K1FR01_9ACTN|nr:ATP-grasp domain-containing protein [Nakamurella alba]MTD15673.1 ATP-grasp domain-containing protein [Nakamurella alba]